MNQLWRINGFFEVELKEEKLNPTYLLKKNAMIENLFLFILSSKDSIFSSNKISEEFFLHVSKTNPSVPSITQTIDHKLNYKFMEWGKISRIQNGKFEIDPIKLTISKKLNSKFNQYLFKKKLNSLPIDIINNLNELDSFINNHSYPIILKEEFGFAGQNQKVYFSNFHFPKNIQFPILIEKWVERIFDFSGIFEKTKNKIKFLNLTKMVCSKNGKFIGISLLKNENFIEISEKLKEIANLLNLENYEGPFSIDGFQYKEFNKIKTQIVSEINFRYTIGRILFELKEKINKNNYYSSLFFIDSVKIPLLENILRTNNISFINLSPITNLNYSKIPIYLEHKTLTDLDAISYLLPF